MKCLKSVQVIRTLFLKIISNFNIVVSSYCHKIYTKQLASVLLLKKVRCGKDREQCLFFKKKNKL